MRYVAGLPATGVKSVESRYFFQKYQRCACTCVKYVGSDVMISPPVGMELQGAL